MCVDREIYRILSIHAGPAVFGRVVQAVDPVFMVGGVIRFCVHRVRVFQRWT